MPRKKTPGRVTVWIQEFRGRKNLMLQWLDPHTGDRKSRSAGTSDRDVAEKARADLEYELSHGLNAEPSSTSWERFCDVFAAEKLVHLGERHQSKASTVHQSFARLMKPKRIGDVTERAISQYATKLRGAGMSSSTIKGHLTYLKIALRWAKDHGYIREVPVIPATKVHKGTNRARIRKAARLTDKDMAKILKACPSDDWRLLVSLCWHCGLRRDEARAIRGEHVDLAGHLILIPANKAGDDDATAFITPELDAFLRRMFGRKIPRGPLISESVSESMGEVSRQFVAIATVAGAEGNSKDGFATLHDLRRNYGSRWAAKVPAQVLRGMMRHSTLQTTLDFYAETESQTLSIMWPEPEAKPRRKRS